MTTLSFSDAASGARLPARVQAYIDALVKTCAQDRPLLVSVVLFGSAAKGGFAGNVSDVDVIIVVSDDGSRAERLRRRAPAHRPYADAEGTIPGVAAVTRSCSLGCLFVHAAGERSK